MYLLASFSIIFDASVKFVDNRFALFLLGGMRVDSKHSKKEEIREKLIEQQGDAMLVRKIILRIILGLIALVVVIGLCGYLYVNSALKPVDTNDHTEKTIEIPIGSSIGTISALLEKKGIVKNAHVFKYYIKFRNESGFQAGKYTLSPSMSITEIVETIKTGKMMKKVAVKITIPEGKQLVQIADIVAEKTGQNPKKVFATLNDEKFIKRMQEKFPALLTNEINQADIMYPLEGYLFPATYDFEAAKPSLETIITAMLKQTEKVLQEYEAQMTEKKFSAHKLLTIASLLEEEATAKVDRSKIASVFYNRLAKGMPLQTDPTVLYAKGKHSDRVYYKDLKVNSPYNTYRYKGLPPGPIANAGKASIRAALEPDKTNFLYFLATPEGDVLYSKTLAEHNTKKAEHIPNN